MPPLLGYLHGANTFESTHSETLIEVVAALETLASESKTRANIGSGSLSDLFALSPSSDDYLGGLSALSKLSASEQTILDKDKDRLNDLLLRVKRDQIMLYTEAPAHRCSHYVPRVSHRYY
jgi:hypothetical protein